MYFDSHTHAFHPKIAHKVLAQLQAHYDIPPVGNGLAEDLLQRAKDAGIHRVVVHTAATDPSQVVPANNWSMSLDRDHEAIVAFGTMHPDFDDMEAEFARLERNGIKGLKFHPDFQGFRMDDPAFHRVLEIVQDRFVCMFHVGDVLPPEQNPSCPLKVAEIRRNFPRLKIIAAHLGGYRHWKWAMDHLYGLDVWLDTSSALPFMGDATLREIFNRHPRDRFLFGSDYPLFDPGQQMRELQRRMAFTDSEMHDLLSAAEGLLE